MLTLLATLAFADDRCQPLRDLVDEDGPCGTAELLHLRDHARTNGLEDCLPDLYAAKGLAAPIERAPADPPSTLLPDKITRDADQQPLPNVVETTNFAVKWNEERGFDIDDVTALADAFEHAWNVEIDGMGYTQPTGTQTYRFNVYIGDTGPGSPSSQGAAGYFWFDGEGEPMIVIAASIVSGRDDAAHTAAHEFFHALQDRAGTYDYEGQGAWYWEATAMWIEGEAFPDDAGWSVFTPFYLYLPELPVNFFEYPEGDIEGYHQYGAALFVRHLTEITTGDPMLIRRSWEEAAPHSDPMVNLNNLLVDGYGTTIHDAFVDHVGRSTTLDYAQHDGIEANLDYYGGWGSEYSHRPTGRIYFANGEANQPETNLPRTYGANFWEVDGMPPAVEAELDGPEDAFGVVGWVTDGEHFRVEIPPDRTPVLIEGLDRADDAWFAVGVVAGPIDRGDTFDYTIRIDETDPPEPEDTDAGNLHVHGKACGCDGSGSAILALPALIAALGTRRRRA